jgi:hypothetical protein
VDLTLRELTESVIGADRPPQPFGTYVFSCTDPGAELGREVERQVFLEYFGNSRELLANEYEPYEPGSMFLCVIDHRRLCPAGVMRMIVPSAVGQKTLADVAEVWERTTEQLFASVGASVSPARIWDISTLAVASDYRGRGSEGLISLALYQALFQAALPFDVDYFVTILDLVVLDLIQTRMGRPLSRFGGLEPRDYLDSPSSLPVYIDIPDYGRRLRQSHPPIHEMLFEGTGIHEAVAPPQWQAAVERVLVDGTRSASDAQNVLDNVTSMTSRVTR